MNAGSHNVPYVMLLILRSLAVAIAAAALYLEIAFFSIFFSGETGTELLIYVVPFMLVISAVAGGVAALFFYLTIWARVGLRRSLTTKRRLSLAWILPVVIGAVVAAAFIIYLTKNDELSKQDVLTTELMHNITPNVKG